MSPDPDPRKAFARAHTQTQGPRSTKTAWGNHQDPHKNKGNKCTHSSEDSKLDKNELIFRATEPERKEFIISHTIFLCFLFHMMTEW